MDTISFVRVNLKRTARTFEFSQFIFDFYLYLGLAMGKVSLSKSLLIGQGLGAPALTLFWRGLPGPLSPADLLVWLSNSSSGGLGLPFLLIKTLAEQSRIVLPSPVLPHSTIRVNLLKARDQGGNLCQ